MSTGELWISHLSVRRWTDLAAWDEYLRAVQAVLGDRLVKLDVNDPARRKANVANGEGQFVTQFGECEDSRWLWGKFEKTKIEFEIKHYKTGADSFGRLRENAITFYIPERMTFGPDAQRLIELFRLSNEHLEAFYAYADFKNVICGKKPSTPSLDISRELLGVFWLTFFGPQYCAFFGRERLLRLEQASEGPGNGITLQLAETAGQIPDDDRVRIEQKIAPESFAGMGEAKASGQHALTLAQLSSEMLQEPGQANL